MHEAGCIFIENAYSLGILLMARRGLRTLIVLIADKFMFSTFKQYSKALEQKWNNHFPPPSAPWSKYTNIYFLVLRNVAFWKLSFVNFSEIKEYENFASLESARLSIKSNGSDLAWNGAHVKHLQSEYNHEWSKREKAMRKCYKDQIH